MEWLAYAEELNRHGASLLESNSYELALECFKGSLEIMSLLAIGFKDGDNAMSLPTGLVWVPPCPQLVAGNNQLGHPSYNATGSPEKAAHPTEALRRSDSSDVDNHYLFEKALNFASSTTDVNPRVLSFYIAIVEFNMALSLHLLSRRVGEKPLHNALHVYDYCLEHLSRSGCSMESSKLLFFAALNNKAAILYDLSSFQMAREVLASLFDAINSCRKTGGLSSIDDNDLEGFLFNVMLLRGACIAPAA